MQNTGIKLKPISCDTLPLGAVGVSQPDLVPDGNGEPFLPQYEPQMDGNFEPMACVSYSLLSHLESQIILAGKPQRNFNDRLLAILSGTTTMGNDYDSVYAAMERAWTCLQQTWDVPPPPTTWPEWYGTPPQAALDEAAALKPGYRLGMRVWATPTSDGFRDALKKCGTLWCFNGYHSFVVYRVDDKIRVFDTYPYNNGFGVGKRDLPLSAFGTNDGVLGGYYVPLIINPDPSLDMFTEKTLYQLMDAPGGFLHFRNGKLIRDTEAKLTAEWQNLSSVTVNDAEAATMPKVWHDKCYKGEGFYFIGGRQGKLTLKDIAGVQLYNTKGEPVTLGNPV